MNLQDYEKIIDQVDTELIQLFSKRMRLSKEFSEYKKEHQIPLLNPKDEREKMDDLLKKTPEDMRDYFPQLYPLLFELSHTYRNSSKRIDTSLVQKIRSSIENTPNCFPEFPVVACQGVEGANSQVACTRLFRKPNIKFFPTFESVFKAIEDGICHYGVIPIENSTAGSVNSVYDLMPHHRFSIIRSIRKKIDHNLLAKPGTKMENIREIYSHEQAIHQCSDFLSSLENVRVIPCENTAVAAKMVVESGRDDIAALASRQCIQYYGLQCLRESVQNTDNNYTRFICISKELEIYPGANRTSLMVTLPHEPGALYKFLSKIYAQDINLIKLESRPLANREFEFMFYFDIEAPVYSPRLQTLLGDLSESYENFHYLGSYNEII